MWLLFHHFEQGKRFRDDSVGEKQKNTELRSVLISIYKTNLVQRQSPAVAFMRITIDVFTFKHDLK